MKKVMKKVLNDEKVISLIEKMIFERAILQIWQIKNDDSRKSGKAQTIRFDMSKEEVVLINKKRSFNFDLSKELYVFWEDNKCIFKTTITFMSEQEMFFHIPKFFMTKEKRLEERTNVADLNYRLNYHLGPSEGGCLEVFPYSTNVLDYCGDGIVLVISSSNIAKFHIGDSITIKLAFADNQFAEGKIAHISAGSGSSNKNYTVGINFH